MLQQQIKDTIQKALKEKDEVRLTVLRGLGAAFINELVATKRKPDAELPDEDALKVIQRSAKQRKEAIDQYQKGGRDDLVKREEAELIILEEYLPKMMSKDEIEKIAKAKKEELRITDKAQIGQLMGAVMKEVKGKADGAVVKEIIESLL